MMYVTEMPVWTRGPYVFGGVGEARKLMSHVIQTLTDTRTVPAHKVQRQWGEVSDDALREPVVITSKGRPRHVLMSFAEYERLKARDRKAYTTDALPDYLIDALEAGLDTLRVPEGTLEDGDVIIR